ncbi:HAMP domain-containing histidine kinase [Streptomyces gardneri]|uniref:sensor histidine kinase n=1 Tax=Nocardia TaxID=1817 RepID=UPI00135A5311|nr:MULTISPECIES: HAMP domain-containing sensor histidine kinase [Nocardia]MBF6165456.1 HAMP domain-containing histidine kinase [Streptomyces gardneri]MBF6206012.1 HAMP domain-containing histidine kinase [Streptomyces gardneri]UAK34523.1 HAMP domain-containing histidine kinase [Nocardia asteroides]
MTVFAQPPTIRRRRSFSLRTRVAGAAAAGAIVIVTLISLISIRAIERNNLQQSDQQLAVAARIVLIEPQIAVQFINLTGLNNDMAVTVRDNGEVVASTATELPALGIGSRTVTVGGTPYRILTTTENQPAGRVVSLGIPAAGAAEATAEQQRWVLGGALLSIAAAAALGWLLAGAAVRPIVRLTRQVGARSAFPDPRNPQVPVEGAGVHESERLAEAVNTMLQRVDQAQAQIAAALETARDFAAVSAHELRTPLTAMRTDLEVLRTLDLDEAQRAEILDDLQRSQGRVESTLAALERLATGDLTNERDHVATDVGDLCDQAAHDAMRHFPGLTVRIDSDAELVTRGLPAGLRLAVDNALANSVKHGGATEALVCAHRRPGGHIVISIDDNGRGIPPEEREAVFDRFFRGSQASKGGSGLGLALVAQQAQLHGGRAYFDAGELGGIRLVLDLPERSAN